MKSLAVLLLAVYVLAVDAGRLPSGRQRAVTALTAGDISLRLLPPEAPHHHHEHHEPAPAAESSSAAPETTTTTTTKRPTAEITRYESENFPDGGYRFLYETSDGQTREEFAYFREDPELGPLLTIRGSYSYIDDQGQRQTTNYTADERGYLTDGGQAPPPSLIKYKRAIKKQKL